MTDKELNDEIARREDIISGQAVVEASLRDDLAKAATRADGWKIKYEAERRAVMTWIDRYRTLASHSAGLAADLEFSMAETLDAVSKLEAMR